MATRFGGTSPSRAYKVQTSWIIGGLAFVVTALIFVVYSLSQDPAEVQGTTVEAPEPAVEVSPTDKVQVLVALKRIEEGTLLEDFMFEPRPFDANQVPAGAILAKDIASIRGKFAGTLINAYSPVVKENISDTQPITAIPIPPGYRAITITVDAQSGVEGFARPGERVDVLWQYTDPQGRQKIATIVRFTRILSLGGNPSAGPPGERAPVAGPTTVTLLVTEQDAKKIGLAMNLGKLSLALVGAEPGFEPNADPGVTDINDIIGNKDIQSIDEPTDGTMYTTGPDGRQVKYVLRNGRWARAEE